MSETITYGPRVTYTATCGVCGAHYAGIGPHCPPKEVESTIRARLAARAYATFLAALGTPEALDGAWDRTVQAVAAEVLSDPRGYARALGLPEPPGLAGTEPVAGLG